jgi:IS30 family transposase
MPPHECLRLDDREDLQNRREPAIQPDKEPAIVVGKLGAPTHLTPQNDQLMSEGRVLCFTLPLRLKWRGQDGQDEAKQCNHRALTLGDSLSRSNADEVFGIHRSPQQIAGWLKRSHPDDETARVSHETIYRSLFIQTRGVLKKELLAHLRATRTIRRSRHASLKREGLGQIKDAISIRERPAAVEDRAIPGHWEGDLIAGAKNSYIVTLVERHTRYVMLARIKNKDTTGVVAALARQVQHLPRELRRSLTWDRGKELADHKRLTLATDLGYLLL